MKCDFLHTASEVKRERKRINAAPSLLGGAGSGLKCELGGGVRHVNMLSTVSYHCFTLGQHSTLATIWSTPGCHLDCSNLGSCSGQLIPCQLVQENPAVAHSASSQLCCWLVRLTVVSIGFILPELPSILPGLQLTSPGAAVSWSILVLVGNTGDGSSATVSSASGRGPTTRHLWVGAN